MKKPLRIASALAVIGLAAWAITPAKPAFAEDQLTVTSWGGSYQQNQHKAVFEPFSKATGIKLTEEEYDGQNGKIVAMVQSKTVSWDSVETTMGTTIQLCAQGILETIDWKKLGLDRAKFTGADTQDCGLPTVTSGLVFAYDKDKLPNGPKSMADFFDTQKFPGKRGVGKHPEGTLEWALVADGVSTKNVYKVLNTPEGVDRAFKKLDTIKKDIVWFESNSQPVQLLADGQVVMTMVPNGRIYNAVRNSGKHFEIVWDAQLFELSTWVIPKGSPHLDAAYKFLAFAGSPQTQAELARYVPYGPLNKDAVALVDPATLVDLPTAPDHMRNVVVKDEAFWLDKGEELHQRFTTWLAQ